MEGQRRVRGWHIRRAALPPPAPCPPPLAAAPAPTHVENVVYAQSLEQVVARGVVKRAEVEPRQHLGWQR